MEIEHLQQQLDALNEHFSAIRRNQEKLMAENKRLREVVKLAENELRKRRQQIAALEQSLASHDSKKREIQDRVDNAIEKLDHVIASTQQEESTDA